MTVPQWLLVALLVGCAWLAQAHAQVAAQVARIDQTQRDDHDRLERIEAQLEYVARLALMQVNDQRAAAGKPLVKDEFPRGGE
jgi:uncharacterized protein YhaN